MPSPFYLPFDYSYHYPDASDGILIPVSLLSGQIFYKASASIDPGATVCLFSREIGEILGLDIEQGLYKRLGTLTGGLDAFGHEVGIQTFDIAVTSTVYFARDYFLPRNLLGRTGWLNKFRFGLIDDDQLIYLSRYDG
jgi:hypothetical protein